MKMGPKKQGESLEVSLDEYIGLTKRLLKLFRMWEPGDNSPKWEKVLVTVTTFVLLACNFLLGLSELVQIRSAQDLRRVASGIGPFWLHFLGFFKWFYLVWKVSTVTKLVGELEECHHISLRISREAGDSSRLSKEMAAAQKNSVKFTYVWSTFVMYGVVHWCTNPILLKWGTERTNSSLFEDESQLPYEAWIPWDTTKSLAEYWYAFSFESLGGVASCIGHISHDVFYTTMAMMICAQFRYLNYLLADQREFDYNETNKKPTASFLKKKLIRGKRLHFAILKFLASFETVASPMMFVQCIGTMGILCLVTFEAMTMNLQGDAKNTIRVWSMMEYIVGCFSQLFVFCYYASQVTALGLRVGDAAYSCGWESVATGKGHFSLDDRARKSEIKSVEFLTYEIITRAQKPVRLTGGPFYVLSLETWTAVVRAGFSYSAVLRELGEE